MTHKVADGRLHPHLGDNSPDIRMSEQEFSNNEVVKVTNHIKSLESSLTNAFPEITPTLIEAFCNDLANFENEIEKSGYKAEEFFKVLTKDYDNYKKSA